MSADIDHADLIHINLTPFEEQVLEAMRLGEQQTTLGRPYYTSTELFRVYRPILGNHWAGPRVVRVELVGGQLDTYPKLNLALGQLRKKGLVKRADWAHGLGKYTAGQWSLTKLGAILLGMTP